MTERTRIRKTPFERKQEPPAELPAKQDSEAKQKRDAELDSLLDEIDTVLEENPQEFVESYIQKGGQAVRVLLNAFLFLLRGGLAGA